MDEETQQPNTSVELAADIIAAYVSGNHVQASELPALIASVYAALTGLGGAIAAEAAGPEKPTPAQVRKSITPDTLTSFEDGKPYKTLRRHLTLRGLTPEDYRTKWGLPADYPMTSATYSAQRSALARELGLGQQRRKAQPAAAPAVETIAEATKSTGRPRKAAETAAEASKARGRKKAAEPA